MRTGNKQVGTTRKTLNLNNPGEIADANPSGLEAPDSPTVRGGTPQQKSGRGKKAGEKDR